MERNRHEGKQEIEGINSKACIEALKIHIQEVIKQEIEKQCSRIGHKFLNKSKLARLLKNQTEFNVQKPSEQLPSKFCLINHMLISYFRQRYHFKRLEKASRNASTASS